MAPATGPKALELMNQYKSNKSQKSTTTSGSGDQHAMHADKKPPTQDNSDRSEKTTEGTSFVTKGVEEEPTDEKDKEPVKQATQALMNAILEEDDEEELCFVSNGVYETGPHPEEGRSVGCIRTCEPDEHWQSEPVEQILSQSNGRVNPNWILLDSQATCNCVANPNLLKNIRPHPNGGRVRIHCNAGSVLVDMVGDLPRFGTVWYQEGGLANVLSLGLVSDSYRVTLDTSVAQSFFVHKEDGTTRRFDRSACGLYFADLTTTEETILNITTVNGKKQTYSDLDLRRAEKARKLQDSLGFPSDRDFLHMVDNNLIANCPVSRRDVLMARDIFGVNTNVVKGKTVRQQPKHVREDISPVPAKILSRYRSITLCVDVFHVNGIKFFRTISRHLYFRTSCVLPDASQGTLFSTITTVIGIYQSRGFTVTQVWGDNEFNCLQDDLLKLQPPVAFHAVTPNEHLPDIERDNRTTRDWVQTTFASLPFKRIPPRMMIELVNGVTFHLNNWCNRVGVSRTMPPRQIMTGTRLDARKHCWFQFGDYVLGHKEAGDNSLDVRARDAIYLRPTGDVQGAMFLFDLKTERRIRRRTATLAHMTDTVIACVEQIAKNMKAPIGLTFGDAQGHSTILDIKTESIASDEDDSDDEYSLSTARTESDLEECDEESSLEFSEDANYGENQSIDGTACGAQNGAPATGGTDTAHAEPPNTTNADGVHSVTAAGTTGDQSNCHDCEVDAAVPATLYDPNGCANRDHDTPPKLEDQQDADGDESVANSAHSTDTVDNQTDSGEDTNTTTNNGHHMELRPRVSQTHNKYGKADGYASTVHHRLATTISEPTGSFFSGGLSNAVRAISRTHERYMLVANAIGEYNNIDATLVTQQYGIKAGLKLFGTIGVDAVLKELKQLHDRKVVTPVHIRTMSREEIQKVLPYLMFLKRKRCGKIKARGCADGRSQRDYIAREDTYSPTVSLHALMLTCVIDAIEERDVATADIPGAFLQTPMPKGEIVHIPLDGAMAEILSQIDPGLYKPYVINQRGTKTLYARADKAIYGTLCTAILFWQKLSSALIKWGFELNPYDSCTANKVINGNQCTIVWHVNDLKISHKDSAVVTKVLADLNAEFGKEAPLTVTRGKVHDYVGMTIDYSTKGKVKFNMFDYLEGIIMDIPDTLREARVTPTPAAEHLFKANAEGTKLNRVDANTFHSVVAQLLFASKRARPDIQTAIAFLCTRVASPDEDDWKKLKRVLAYVCDTIFLPLVLGWDETGNAYWYVDASFAVHTDMKSHTGGLLTFRMGAVLAISIKQKLNTRSSTEAELVGVDDTLPYNLWCHYYLEWQGYQAKIKEGATRLGKENFLYQDNTSSIKLETNGKSSSTKRTRHINIRYFLITDRVKKGEISVEYCPTGDMIADFFTKPLQGSLFKKFRNMIMGVMETEDLAYKSDYYAAKNKRKKEMISQVLTKP